MRWHKNILAVIFAVTGAAGICCAWAADKKGLEYLEFIPSDEIVDFKTQSYANKSISEVSCNCGDRNYFQEAADCL